MINEIEKKNIIKELWYMALTDKGCYNQLEFEANAKGKDIKKYLNEDLEVALLSIISYQHDKLEESKKVILDIINKEIEPFSINPNDLYNK